MKRDIDPASPEVVLDITRQRTAVRVIVEGPPAIVQRIADAIGAVIPGFINWEDHALSGSNDDSFVLVGIQLSKPRRSTA